MAIAIGLSLAWVGNIQALLQEKEIEKLAKHHPDGLQTYVYTFQLSILVILVTAVAWALAALGVYGARLLRHDCVQFVIEAVLYFLASLALRECWEVVKGSQLLILTRAAIRSLDKPG